MVVRPAQGSGRTTEGGRTYGEW